MRKPNDPVCPLQVEAALGVGRKIDVEIGILALARGGAADPEQQRFGKGILGTLDLEKSSTVGGPDDHAFQALAIHRDSVYRFVGGRKRNLLDRLLDAERSIEKIDHAQN